MRPFLLCLAAAVALAPIACEEQPTPPPSANTMTHTNDTDPTHTNALANSTSPYLLQHAHNPVDWRPWGDEAFAAAREQGKPVFLSVGYSTCHWCHVMAHESFEDEAVAAVLNEHFICIKVDREELPDVDNHYMLATQAFHALSGNPRAGGWPNSVWLNGDGEPFYAGTYFPREMFINLLTRLAELYRTDASSVSANAEAITATMARLREHGDGDGGGTIDRGLVDDAVGQITGMFDPRNGGFGLRPKFPPHANLSLLLDRHERRADQTQLRMITTTLDAMRRGGVYDHVGGGFHRYATDDRWFLPHFEKMLYDNAQLIDSYARAYKLTGDERYRRVVAETFAWLKREMLDPNGGFYSALDADSEGEEGKFYVWPHDEIIDVLGPDDGPVFAEMYRAHPDGNFRDEATGEPMPTNIPHLRSDVPEGQVGRFDAMRAKLLERRDQRIRPHLDDKVLVSWNGLMIEALAAAGALLDEPRYTQAAARAATFVLNTMRQANGQLLRTYRKGEAKLAGYLDDYAYLAAALVKLYDATGDEKWLTEARAIADVMADQFAAPSGGFYYTSVEHDDRIDRTVSTGGGGNLPNPNGVAARVLLRLGDATGESRYLELAEATLTRFSRLMRANVFEAGELIHAAADYIDRPDVDAISTQGPVRVRVAVGAGELDRIPITVDLSIADGYHVYAPNPGNDSLTPTSLGISADGAISIKGVTFPDPTRMDDPILGEAMNVYTGDVRISATIGVGEIAPFTLKLTTQPCDDRACLQPQTHTLRLHVD